MTAPSITPLERWTCRKIGLDGSRLLNRRGLRQFQLDALNRTLLHVRKNSPFYRRRFSNLPPGPLKTLHDLTAFPFTCAADIRYDPFSFLCVSQDRIARVVTLSTSGTTGGPKRLFFTHDDLDLTVDFFHHGMATLVGPGQRVLILMPGTLPGSIGDLLTAGLARVPSVGIVHGPVQDPGEAIGRALCEKVHCLVGIPVQVLAMACHEQGPALAGQIQTVLLSADYVPEAIVGRLQRTWGCRVFKHYGMTEMGLGGAVECASRDGYHFREADLLVEIVDPATGAPVPDGVFGEILFTTLTRAGMPLVRYRTGDGAAFRVDRCPCGTALKTLGAVTGRLDGAVSLGRKGGALFLSALDEAVFGISPVLDYEAEIHHVPGGDHLILFIATGDTGRFDLVKDRVARAVQGLTEIARAMATGTLTLSIAPARHPFAVSTGTGKRRFGDYRPMKNR